MTKTASQRTGVLARKLGMSRQFQADGSSVPVSILLMDRVQVVGARKEEKHGYNAVILGYGKRKKGNKPLLGVYPESSNIDLKQKYCEFRTSADQLLDVSTDLKPDHFTVGQKVDVTGVSIGRGFAGAMKRHNFRGLRASHGVSVSHRSHGSTGNSQDPGRVFKNKKMAGHMGAQRVTVQNLKIMGHDVDKDLLIVQGAIPGARNGWVYVRDAIKSPMKSEEQS